MKTIEFIVKSGIVSVSIPSVAYLRVLMTPLPNIEPIMLFTIVTALALGPISGFVFGFGTMFLSDFLMGRPGPWTLYTSLAFGLVGLIVGFLGLFIRNKNFSSLKGRAELFAITFAMTIFWDFTTATFFAFEFFMPLQAAFFAQIPFTLLHLSNCLFAFLFAPYLVKVYSVGKDCLIINFLRVLRVYT